VNGQIDLPALQRPLNLFRKQPLPADLAKGTAFNVPLRRNRHELDCRPARPKLRSHPFGLPHGKSAAASAKAKNHRLSRTNDK
jgi:hypothetical protein